MLSLYRAAADVVGIAALAVVNIIGKRGAGMIDQPRQERYPPVVLLHERVPQPVCDGQGP